MKAVHERTTLMHSEELGSILANWHQPPRQHDTGIRMKAAKEAMTSWAIETVSDLIDDEIQALEPVLPLLRENLSRITAGNQMARSYRGSTIYGTYALESAVQCLLHSETRETKHNEDS